MNLFDKVNISGHLQIVKKINATGEEEIIFDDHNVITGGLGRSIAQWMSVGGCLEEDGCLPLADNPPPGQDYFANWNNGGAATMPRLPDTAADWTRNSPLESPGTTGEAEGGADLSTSEGTTCYCVESLIMSVMIEQNVPEAGGIDFFDVHVEVLNIDQIKNAI